VQETRLAKDVYVQVLDIENLSKSRWDQIEELEAIERGEQTRGRQIIRLPNRTDDSEEGGVDIGIGESQEPPVQGSTSGTNTANARAGGVARVTRGATHKLVLQDFKGQQVFALELKPTDKIGLGTTSIGEKMLLKSGTVVARGIVLLEPGTCVILGGKVEAWQKSWTEGRLKRLREAVGGG
jgi:RecQ-mediated genome instability protein 1